ncbi:hypothetical protein HPULCUR_001901 [Helicostylum pulchrum]|uniref:Uncharacterized protein n=1 Tax=Helicostylum pulchrum TaxID=562976 RepID=A0ABP9XP34_9FUNG
MILLKTLQRLRFGHPSTLDPPSTKTEDSYANATQLSKSSSRSTISLLNPSGKPMILKAGTVPHSVYYALPVAQMTFQGPLLTALRELSPLITGLGLTIKESQSHRIFELALATAENCNSAMSSPITITHGEQSFAFPAFPEVSSGQGLLKLNLSELDIMNYDTLKTRR